VSGSRQPAKLSRPCSPKSECTGPFADSLIESIGAARPKRILDPWNGSGTTSALAALRGHEAQGFDINPVMVVAARARMLSSLSVESLLPLAADIHDKAKGSDSPSLVRPDPLWKWVIPESASAFRRIESAIQHLLVRPSSYQRLAEAADVNTLSDLASFLCRPVPHAAKIADRLHGFKPYLGETTEIAPPARPSVIFDRG